MNNFRKKYSLTAFILIFVFSVSGESKKSDSESVENKTKEDRKKKGSGLAKIGDDEIRFLRRLLELPPERLRMLRKTIERLENYSEEEREVLKDKLAHFRNGSPEERDKKIEDLMRRHALLREHIGKLPPGERASRMKKFQSLNLTEKKRFLDDLRKSNEKRKNP
ncbi:MAG: hypothetical protein VX609_04280 [Verrucomicrobiota bacterium]|nr:hypothetical protein [Verrucomicrobiota bacterium]